MKGKEKESGPDRIDFRAKALEDAVNVSKVHFELEIGRRDDEITRLKEEKEGQVAQARAMGILQKIGLDNSYNELLQAMTLFKVKEMRAYREGGFNWAQFCEAVRIPWHTADRMIADIRPLYERLSSNVEDFAGLPFNKIRQLGKGLNEISSTVEEFLTAEGVFDAETALAAIQIAKEQNRQAEDELSARDKAAARVQEELHKTIVKQEREIARLEKQAPLDDLTDEEREAMDLLSRVEGDFIQGIMTIRKKAPYATAPRSALRAYYFMLLSIQKIARDERLELAEFYTDAEEPPWEIMDDELPAAHVLVNESPLTRGMGPAYLKKVTELAVRAGNKHTSAEGNGQPKE